MKRYFKRIGASLLAGAISVAAFAPVNASAEFEYYGEFGFEHPITTTTPGALIPGNNDDGLIREILTSAIDGNPFAVYFNPNTGRVSSFDLDGGYKGHRYVDGKQAFLDLVAINIEVTTPRRDLQRTVPERVNRNVSQIDLETRMLIVYDEYGNVTETYLGEAFYEMVSESRGSLTESRGIAPLFDTGFRSMFVPFASSPTPADGRSAFVGGGFFQTTTAHREIELRTQSFPGGMSTLDAFFTNAIGDDNATVLNIGPNRMVWRAIRFPGEAYAARVSSFNGGFSNVSLRFLAIGGSSVTPSGVTVTLNANGGSVNPSSIVRTPGSTYGSAGSLPTPTRSGRFFVDWFNTSSTVGGTRIRNHSTVSNSNHTLFARWTDPSRHDNRWWLPSNLGTTVIPIRIAGNPAVNWRTGIQNGVANWNSTNTAIDFRFDNNTIDTVSTSNWSEPWYGRVRLFHNGATTVVGYEIQLNMIEISHSRTLTNHTSQGIINFTTSVMVHELGHILGLRDGPSGFPVGGGVNNSVMNYGRNRNTLLRPTSFDITGVNMIYN